MFLAFGSMCDYDCVVSVMWCLYWPLKKKKRKHTDGPLSTLFPDILKFCLEGLLQLILGHWNRIPITILVTIIGACLSVVLVQYVVLHTSLHARQILVTHFYRIHSHDMAIVSHFFKFRLRMERVRRAIPFILLPVNS